MQGSTKNSQNTENIKYPMNTRTEIQRVIIFSKNSGRTSLYDATQRQQNRNRTAFNYQQATPKTPPTRQDRNKREQRHADLRSRVASKSFRFDNPLGVQGHPLATKLRTRYRIPQSIDTILCPSSCGLPKISQRFAHHTCSPGTTTTAMVSSFEGLSLLCICSAR